MDLIEYTLIARTTITAVGFMAVLFLSPLLVDIVNMRRSRASALLTSEEIYEAYPLGINRIFACSACRALWMTAIAAAIYAPASGAACYLQLFFMTYVPALFIWLVLRQLYRKCN